MLGCGLLPLDNFNGIFDLDKLILLVVEEIEREIVFERVVGKEDTV